MRTVQIPMFDPMVSGKNLGRRHIPQVSHEGKALGPRRKGKESGILLLRPEQFVNNIGNEKAGAEGDDEGRVLHCCDRFERSRGNTR